jgi:F-box-like
MQLIEIKDESHWELEGSQNDNIDTNKVVIETAATINHLPNEVLFNVFDNLLDDKPLLSNCLTVSKRWYDLALPLLWHEFQFDIHLRRQLRQLDCLLSVQENPGFLLVRNLTLNVNLRGERVTSSDRCQEIANTIRQYIEFLRVSTGIQNLRLGLQPFVEMDAHQSRWQELEANNSIIMELVDFAATRKYSELFLDVQQPKWQFEEGNSDIYRHYVEALGPQITRLHLCETASEIWPWLTSLRRLRRLHLENMGNANEESLTKFWDTIARFPLEELNLAGVTFPQEREFKKWRSIRMIILNQFNNVEGTCSRILESFPNLRFLSLNNANNLHCGNSFFPFKEIVTPNLRPPNFNHCRPQQGIISLIAQSVPNLEMCLPPDNASDSDIVTLIDCCPFLRILQVDGCYNITRKSIQYMPNAKRLQSLKVNADQLLFLDKDCILTLTENCPDLHSREFRVSTMGEENEKIRRILVG